MFGISLFIKEQEGYLFVEDRPKGQVVDIIEKQSIDTIDLVMKDQIYFRDDIIKGFLKIFDRFSFSDKAVCFDREKVKIKNAYYDNSYSKLDDSILETCANKAYNINEISNLYPEVKCYVYNPVRYLEESIFEDIYIPNNYYEIEDTFLSYLGDKVKYKKLKYQDKDFTNLFYKTDHHYNVYGADKTYNEIIDMINEDYEVGSPKPLIDINVLDTEYQGSYCKLNESINDIYDTLSDGVYGIDPNEYSYYINGEKSSLSTERELFIKENTHTTREYDAYYNSNSGEMIFDWNTPEKKNLLVITDSYIGPIKEVLSSHFNKTLIIAGYDSIGRLSLSDVINKNNIDIILVLLFQQNLYYNGYYFIPVN